MNLNTTPILIENSNPEWFNVFKQLQLIFTQHLHDAIITIEHVGSTSISNLPAKPIIDIDIVIESRLKLPTIIEKLNELGYVHNGDQGIPGREAFIRKSSNVPYTGSNRQWMEHHLYVCAKNSSELQRHLAFRDYLRAHPQIARKYGKLKKDLALKFSNDREGYTESKTDFIEEILALAMKK